MVYQVNGEQVCIIGLDVKREPMPDDMRWKAYKAQVLGIWPGEPDEDADSEFKPVQTAIGVDRGCEGEGVAVVVQIDANGCFWIVDEWRIGTEGGAR